jgi:hypothetical protein
MSNITVTGTPLTDDEFGALMAVLHAKRRVRRLRSACDRPSRGGWASRHRALRTPLVPGRDAWRRS